MLLVIVSAWALAGAPAPATALAAHAQGERAQLAWTEVLRRDGRLGFTSEGGGRALRLLGKPDLEETERALALLTLGAAGFLSERQRLQSWAVEGQSLERRAAILGLGELAATGPGRIGDAGELLAKLSSDPDPEIAECALLALLRTQVPRWRDLVSEHSNRSGDPLGRVAGALLVFCFDPVGSTPTPASELLLDLRWKAARTYGTVDGRAWEAQLLAKLEKNEDFLDGLVLSSAAELARAGVKDHMLSLLLNGKGDARLRAVVRSMAPELDALIAADLWAPASEAEWIVLVNEALEARLSAFLPKLLERSLRYESVRAQAAGALARKDERFLETLASCSKSEDARWRAAATVGMRLSGRGDFIARLLELSQDADPAVRAGALVARLSLDERRAKEDVPALLRGTASAELSGVQDPRALRVALIEALEAAYMSPHISEFLEQQLDALDRAELGGVLACLFLRGRMTETVLLREAWDYQQPGSLSQLRLVRAIGRFPSAADIEFLAEKFPQDDQPELNLELARSLLRAGHPEVFPMLESAIWDKHWDRSVLATAVVLEVSGIRRLLNWIDSPPSRASSEDLRRLGFAIGEWAGQDGLEQLIHRLGPRAGAEKPELQGALLGLLVSRTH